MTETSFPSSSVNDNLVDKAASSAAKAVDATKGVATAALDSVNEGVESVRSTLSPALDQALVPVESVIRFTREHPVSALMASAAVGAVVSAMLRPTRRGR
jgi:ElaB/YqjD/DUF883 family membrane-anchored ribosome-binding protein